MYKDYASELAIYVRESVLMCGEQWKVPCVSSLWLWAQLAVRHGKNEAL